MVIEIIQSWPAAANVKLLFTVETAEGNVPRVGEFVENPDEPEAQLKVTRVHWMLRTQFRSARRQFYIWRTVAVYVVDVSGAM
jgi:hypothetical protein